MADLHHRTKNTINGGRHWSSLPSDLLAFIANNFLPLPDHIRFRSVCKSWSHSVPHLAMPLPLLVLPTNAVDSLTFCSLASPQTTFNSPVPPGVAGAHIVGSHDGWLAFSDLALNVFLFNPFTADRIDLPSFTELYDPSLTTESHRCYIKKIVFSSSPTPQNLMAVAIDMFRGVVYTRAGEDIWNPFMRGTDPFLDDGVLDVMFHVGRFWVLNKNGELWAVDLRGTGLPEVSLPFNMFAIDSLGGFCNDVDLSISDSVLSRFKYLAVGSDGNIVVVFRVRFNDRRVVVIEIVGPEFNRARRVWGLWDHSLFVGYNNGFSFPVENGHQLRRNCVFINDIFCEKCNVPDNTGVFGMGEQSYVNKVYNMIVFDMRNEWVEVLFPQHTKFTWCQPPPTIFMPSIKLNSLEFTFGTDSELDSL